MWVLFIAISSVRPMGTAMSRIQQSSTDSDYTSSESYSSGSGDSFTSQTQGSSSQPAVSWKALVESICLVGAKLRQHQLSNDSPPRCEDLTRLLLELPDPSLLPIGSSQRLQKF